jgi:hypothetical protein
VERRGGEGQGRGEEKRGERGEGRERKGRREGRGGERKKGQGGAFPYFFFYKSSTGPSYVQLADACITQLSTESTKGVD